MSEHNLKNQGKEFAKSAVAVATATGVALGGAFGSKEELPNHNSGENISIVEMLNPDTDEGDDGLAEEEKQRKIARKRTLKALAVGVGVSLLLFWGISALCALLPSTLPAFLLTGLRWALTAAGALAALSVTLKVAAPEEPIIASLHRCYKKTLLLCLFFCCTEGALLWFFPQHSDYLGKWLRLLAITGSILFLLKKEKKSPPPPEKSDREKILALADSVGKK